MNPVPQEHFGIGIDTARYGHHVSFLDEQKRTAAKPFHFTEDAKGYQKLEAAINKLRKKHTDCVLHIRVDAAGQYAENLLRWLHRLDGPSVISVGQPARNKAYQKVHYEKRKADPVDSLACARFAIVERPPAMHQPQEEFSILRDAVAQMEASATARTRLINQLHNMLARAFPEFAVLVKNVGSKSILKLLQKYPTAERMAAARLDSIAKLPHIDKELAGQLHEAAKNSTASSRSAASELLIKRKVKSILDEIEVQEELDAIVKNAVKELPAGPHRRIRSIPGIGTQTEAALLAKIVSIDRFGSARALIGYFGIFPEEVDVSGLNKDGTPKSGKEMRMSRKGNDLVRRLLYTAAQTAVKHNPPVRAMYARLIANGKDYNTAIGHCMAKLLRQVFAVWKQDCEFDPQWEAGATQGESQPVEPTEMEAPQEEEKVAGHSQAQRPSRKVVTATDSIVAAPRRPLNFADLRSLVSMTDVLQLLNWSVQSNRATLRGPCPVHRSSSPNSTSFAVNVTKKVYCCHSCGSEGNALDLWAATQNMSLFDASWDLIERLGLEAPLLQKKEENCTVRATPSDTALPT